MSEHSTDDFEEYDEVEGVSGFVVLIIGTLILAVFCLSIFLAYQHGIQSRGTQLPRIAADPNPVKTERELSVGAAQDREVFDHLEGVTKSEIIIAAEASTDPLQGFPEVSSAANSGSAAADRAGAASKAEGGSAASSSPSSALSPSSSPSSSGADAELTVPKELRKITVAPRVKPKPPAAQEQTRKITPPRTQKPKTIEDVLAPAAAAPEKAAAAPDRAAAGAESAARALKGSHLVQVAAFRSEADARAHYAKLKKKFGAIVADKVMHVERTDLKEKGIYYRLRLGPFTSKGAASSYCVQLKSGGEDCLVKAL